MSIVVVVQAEPLLLKPYVTSGAINLNVYDEQNGVDVTVPHGHSVRDDYRPGLNSIEARVLDHGGTAFTVTDASGPWARPPGAGYCSKSLAVPSIDYAEYTYPITIAAAGATARNQTIIIRRRPL